MKSPLTLSIVTATYNQSKYISQCIKSVISQEGNFYIDYIIINDGSTDDTASVIEKYDVTLKNGQWPVKCMGVEYRFVHRQNGGQASALNDGFRMAHGDIFAWMNSDDYYLPGAFQVVAKVFEEDPELDFIYTDCLKIYANGRPSSIEPRPRPNETFESIRTRGSSFSLNFFTKHILEKTGYLNESLKYCIDLDQWYRIFQVAKVKYVPYTAGAFRWHPLSKTATSQKKFAEERGILAKRYGGNIIPSRKIYKFRGKMKILDVMKQRFPKIYGVLKKIFYKIVDSFKYRNNPSSNL
ncbi:MAG: glycosyltransferase [Candidatus Zambryskibacteria bacterium]|nr:glycosyltransferase [Candidatus Zambryskibacteria bacterium]